MPNKSNALEYIPHLQALHDGELQGYSEVMGKWVDLDKVAVDFSLLPDKYRRKPKPRKLYAILEGYITSASQNYEELVKIRNKHYSPTTPIITFVEEIQP